MQLNPIIECGLLSALSVIVEITIVVNAADLLMGMILLDTETGFETLCLTIHTVDMVPKHKI